MPNPTDNTEGPLLETLQETSDDLTCSVRQTYNLIEEGELEAVHMGRAARIVTASKRAYVERLRQREAERRAARTQVKTFEEADTGKRASGPAEIPIKA